MHKLQRRLAVLAGGLVTLLGLQAATVVAQEDAAPDGAVQESAQESSQQSSAGEDYKREDDSRNPFSFSVSESLYYDSNLYRLPDNFPDANVPKGKRSDFYSVTRAGVDFDGERGRQTFRAGFAASYVMYGKHTDLNNLPWDGYLSWDWRIGNRLSGVLGYSYGDSFVGFGDNFTGRNAIDRERVMRQLQRANASIDFWWHPNWATGVGYTGVWTSYDNEQYDYGKYDAQQASVNITYRPSTGNRIVLSWRAEDGRYPNYPATTGSMRDWQRRDFQLSGHWQLTGVTQVNGYVGYTTRKYDLAHNRDFNGITGKIAIHWVPTAKAIIDLAWRREIGADADLVSNYAASQGWSIRPTWVATSKIRVGASYEYLNRDYRGDSGADPGSWYRPRDAKTQSFGLNLQYQPVPMANVTLGYQYQERNATTEDYGFDTWTVWLSGRLTF